MANVTFNFAALRLAAAEDTVTFMKFASAFNTYDIRNGKGLPSDRATKKAYSLLIQLQMNTKENLGVSVSATLEEKEACLDAIYAEVVKATRLVAA